VRPLDKAEKQAYTSYMTMLPLPPDLEAALAARAAAEGISVEALVLATLREATGAVSFASDELEAAWQAEILRRCEEVDAGLVKPIPWEEALNQLRQSSSKSHAA
jgi:plasmid stability protein